MKQLKLFVNDLVEFEDNEDINDTDLNKEVLKKQKDKINQILELCCESCEIKEKSKKLQEVYKEIEIYVKDNRFLYSVVSSYIFNIDDFKIDILQSFMDELVAYADMNNKDEKVKKAILKLWDHINLAVQQEVYVKDIQSKILAKFKREVKPKIDKSIKAAKQTEKSVKNLYGQLISIVSIFTAISFVVFGGIASFQNIFADLHEVPITKMIIIGCIWMFGITNIIYLLIYYMSKIINVNIKSCTHMNATFIQKHASIVFLNLIYLTIFIFSSLARIIAITFDKQTLLQMFDVISWIIFLSIISVFLICLAWNKYFKHINDAKKFIKGDE